MKKIWGLIACVLACALPQAGYAASLFLSPAGDTEFSGQSFDLSVNVAATDQAMNAVQGNISFPIDKLSVVSLSKANSLINLWVQEPSFSNKSGMISFEGVVVNPGYQGPSGKILSITFRAKNPGAAPITFTSGSVLANDGLGTNILSVLKGSAVNISSPSPGSASIGEAGLTFVPIITSVPSVADQGWYNFDNIIFKWNTTQDTSAVNYGISTNPTYALPAIDGPVSSETTYDVNKLTDGEWYFFLSLKRGGVWTPATAKSFQLDHTPPEPFVITRVDEDTSDISPVFRWGTTDAASGVAYYRARIGDGDWFDPAEILEGSNYVLPAQSPAQSRSLTVRAYDAAGNMRASTIYFTVRGAKTWYVFVSRFLFHWGWLVTLIFTIATVSQMFIYYFFISRRVLHKEFNAFRTELEGDLRRFEETLAEEEGRGSKSSGNPPTAQALHEEIQHIHKDLSSETRKMENLDK